MLIARDIKSLHRNPLVLVARMMLTGFMAILSGMIFWQIGGSNPNDRTVRRAGSNSFVMYDIALANGNVSFHR